MTGPHHTQSSRLAKLLSLAASDNDGEALAAIRAAIAEVNRSGEHWTDFSRRVGGPPIPEEVRRSNNTHRRVHNKAEAQWMLGSRSYSRALSDEEWFFLNEVVRGWQGRNHSDNSLRILNIRSRVQAVLRAKRRARHA